MDGSNIIYKEKNSGKRGVAIGGNGISAEYNSCDIIVVLFSTKILSKGVIYDCNIVVQFPKIGPFSMNSSQLFYLKSCKTPKYYSLLAIASSGKNSWYTVLQ